MSADSNGKYQLTVDYDGEREQKLMINGELGFKDPWMDLGLLLEGVGLLINTVIGDGKTEHNGLPLNDYLKNYIDSACNDYSRTKTPHRKSH